MKILHLIDSGGLYGAEMVVLNLAQEQLRQGDDASIGSIASPGHPVKAIEEEARRRGIPVDRIEVHSGLNPIAFQDMARYLRGCKADVVHTHGYKADVLVAMLPRWIRRLAVVSTLHGWIGARGSTRNAFYEAIHGRVLGRLDAIVGVGEHMRAVVPLARASRFIVIPNGLGEAVEEGHSGKYVSDELSAFCARCPTVLTIGRLAPEKDYLGLIDAVDLLRKAGDEIQLLIVGEGRLRGKLLAHIQDKKLGDVVWLAGYLDSAFRLMQMCTVYAISSVTEGLPITLLEAMREGIPVVATSVGDVPRVLQFGDAGVLVDARDPHALSAAIRELIYAPELRFGLVRRARELWRMNYSAAAMAVSYRKVYQSVGDPQ